jgi:hypothetical protein
MTIGPASGALAHGRRPVSQTAPVSSVLDEWFRRQGDGAAQVGRTTKGIVRRCRRSRLPVGETRLVSRGVYRDCPGRVLRRRGDHATWAGGRTKAIAGEPPRNADLAVSGADEVIGQPLALHMSTCISARRLSAIRNPRALARTAPRGIRSGSYDGRRPGPAAALTPVGATTVGCAWGARVGS